MELWCWVINCEVGRAARDAPKSRVAARPMWLGTHPSLHNRDPDAAGKIIGIQGVIPIDSFSTKAVTLTIES